MSDLKLVKYSATWCGPCKQFAPVAEKVTRELGIELEDVDIDENPTPGIMSVPTIRLVRGGEVLGEQAGAMSPVALKKWIAARQ